MLSAVPGMETALGIYWLNAVMTQSTRWEEGVSYVVKILACSVTVPATVNPKAFLPSFDSLYEFLLGFLVAQ